MFDTKKDIFYVDYIYKAEGECHEQPFGLITSQLSFVSTHLAKKQKEHVSGPQVNRRNRAPFTPPSLCLSCLSSQLQYPVSFVLPAVRPTALPEIRR